MIFTLLSASVLAADSKTGVPTNGYNAWKRGGTPFTGNIGGVVTKVKACGHTLWGAKHISVLEISGQGKSFTEAGKGSSNCKTVDLGNDDCITGMDVFADVSVEKITFKTYRGKTLDLDPLGSAQGSPKSSFSFNK